MISILMLVSWLWGKTSEPEPRTSEKAIQAEIEETAVKNFNRSARRNLLLQIEKRRVEELEVKNAELERRLSNLEEEKKILDSDVQFTRMAKWALQRKNDELKNTVSELEKALHDEQSENHQNEARLNAHRRTITEVTARTIVAEDMLAHWQWVQWGIDVDDWPIHQTFRNYENEPEDFGHAGPEDELDDNDNAGLYSD